VLATLAAEARQVGTRHCHGCGEDSPANFDLCWNCGAAV